MEKFYFERPSLERKEKAIEYINEHVEANSTPNGCGGLNRVNHGVTYEEWLEDVLRCEEKAYAESKGLVPGTTYFTIRESDNKIIGMVNFRYYLNEELLRFGGHIGYGIRPTERRKGYSKIQLYMSLKEASKLNIDKIMVSCVDTNIGSEKTIVALDGIYERTEEVEKYGNVKVYWIDVEETIEKYKDIYGKYIRESNIKRK